MHKLFLLGCGRSGTTMLQQALNRHSKIVIPPETDFFHEVVGRSAWFQRLRLEQIERELGIELPARVPAVTTLENASRIYGEIGRLYARRLNREDAIYFGDKSPRHLLVASRLCRLCPDAKFLVIYRDGRDVAVSLQAVPWAPSDIYLNFDWWLEFWRAQRWLLRHGNVDVCCIRYETLVQRPDEELARISEFLGLEFEVAMAEGSGNKEGILDREAWKQRAVAAINTTRINVWRRKLTPFEVGVLESWGGEALEDLGYMLETDGRARLPTLFRLRLEARRARWRMSRLLQLARKEVALAE